MVSRPRVLLVDDHRIVAEGLRSLLVDEFELVGIVEDGRAMITAAGTLRPDVIVADISMPGLNGIEALVQLKRDDPEVKVVFLTMHAEVRYARRALEEGASGFVLKHSAATELVTAIRAALDGQTYITPAMAGELFRSVHEGAPPDPSAALTPRQREILQLLAEGSTTKEIAAALDISVRTVEFHKYRMMESLALDGTADLVRFAIKHGIVEI